MGRKLILASLLLSLLAARVQTTHATTFLRLESTYLGDGWFQYHMTVMNDPFFLRADITTFGVDFTNQIAHPEVANWTNSYSSSSYVSWGCASYPQTRPYEATFLARSSQTSFRRGLGTVLMSLWSSEFYPADAVSGNIAGYVNMPCLKPCDAAHADGSSPILVYDLKLIPDIDITRLIQTNSAVYGVEFKSYTNATMVLQGTPDFTDWTNITYVRASGTNTIWATNQPLNKYGQYFRLAVVSYADSTNLPPLTKSLLSKPKAMASFAPSLPRVASCLPMKDKVQVTIEAPQNQKCTIQALSADGGVVLEKHLKVSGTSGTVNFDPDELPNPVFFRVLAR